MKHIEYPPGYLVSERPADAVDQRSKKLSADFDTPDAELWARNQAWYPRVIGRSVVRYRAIWWLAQHTHACDVRREHGDGECECGGER